MKEIGEAHPSADRLLDLVQGLLSGQELDGTLRHLKSCRACEERFRAVGRESQILRIRGSRAAGSDSVPNAAATPALSQLATPPPALPAIDRASPQRRRWVWPLTAGAAIAGIAAVLVLVATWPLLRNAPREPDDLDYWLPVERERVMLRSSSAGDESGPLLDAVEAYGRHDTARVVELLANRDLSYQHTSLRLMLASALVWQGRNTEARDLLIRWEIILLPQPDRDRARWILYIARKRSGEEEAANTIARDLTSRPGEFAERAKRALARTPSPASR